MAHEIVRRPRRWHAGWLVLATVAAGWSGPAAGQSDAAGGRIGQRVAIGVPEPVRLTEGDRELAEDPDRDGGVWVVTEERDGRLRLRAEGSARAGWAEARQVVPAELAVEHFTRLIQAAPSAWAYHRRAIARLGRGDHARAGADFDEAIRREPDAAAHRIGRGLARHDAEEYDAALADFEAAIRLDPKSAPAYRGRGIVREARGELDGALADYNAAIRLDPGYAMAYYNRGNLWGDRQELDRAIADYTEAIQLDPGTTWTYRNRGVAWIDKGEYAKAIADFDAAIRLDPNHAEAHYLRGNARSHTEDHDRAIADYTEAIRLDPRDSWAYNNRGITWYREQDYDKAIADLTAAIRLDPDRAAFWVNRGLAWGDKGVYAKALADFNEAIGLDPNMGEALADRAWLLATCPDARFRDGAEAVASALKACELARWERPTWIDALAAAHAEAGDFAKAVAVQEKANALYDDPEDRKIGEERLALYRAGKPYREEP